MNARDMEVAIAKHFDYRKNIIVPRVAWGLGLHECDMLVLSKAGYASEIEIKISRADLLRDARKDHQHESNLIKAFYFAVPESLADFALEKIPAEAGLLAVRDCPDSDVSYSHPRVKLIRSPIPRNDSRGFTEAERYQMARLGLIRYWCWRGPIPEAFAEVEA